VLSGLRVLVVDDNETNRTILVEMLSAWGLEPSAATGGKEALEALKRAQSKGLPLRLIITDMQMPGMDGCDLSHEVRRNPDFGRIPIVLLSSSARHGEATRCRKLAIASYLTKPVQPSELLAALLAAVSHTIDVQKLSPATAVPAEDDTPRLKILIAEDNAVNRILATALLEKRGHTVLATENGREAIDTLERETVDMVLMDIQMPVMDGFEAIRAIRKKEQITGAHLPIIALTAHAMKGDRERCLEAGADEYVTKPIRMSELFAAMKRVETDKPGPTLVTPPSAAAVPSHNLDMAAALERVDGDRELFEELARLFADESPENMARIRQGMKTGDARAIEMLAHKIKGAALSLGCPMVSEAASDLESHARTGELGNAAPLVENLKRQLDLLLPALESFCRQVTL